MRRPLLLLVGWLLVIASPIGARAAPASMTPQPATVPAATVPAATVPACIAECIAGPDHELTTGNERIRVAQGRYAMPPAAVGQLYLTWAAAAGRTAEAREHDGIHHIVIGPGPDGASPAVARVRPEAEAGAAVTVTTSLPRLPRLPSWVPACAGCRATHLLGDDRQLLAVLTGRGSPAHGAHQTDTAFRAAGWTTPIPPPAARFPTATHTRRYLRDASVCVIRVDDDDDRAHFRVALTCHR